MPASKAPKQINPRSRIKVLGKSSDFRKSKEPPRRKVSTMRCPRCRDWMYADQVIDMGTIDVAGTRHTGRHHRTCEEKTA